MYIIIIEMMLMHGFFERKGRKIQFFYFDIFCCLGDERDQPRRGGGAARHLPRPTRPDTRQQGMFLCVYLLHLFTVKSPYPEQQVQTHPKPTTKFSKSLPPPLNSYFLLQDLFDPNIFLNPSQKRIYVSCSDFRILYLQGSIFVHIET